MNSPEKSLKEENKPEEEPHNSYDKYELRVQIRLELEFENFDE